MLATAAAAIAFAPAVIQDMQQIRVQSRIGTLPATTIYVTMCV